MNFTAHVRANLVSSPGSNSRLAYVSVRFWFVGFRKIEIGPQIRVVEFPMEVPICSSGRWCENFVEIDFLFGDTVLNELLFF